MPTPPAGSSLESPVEGLWATPTSRLPFQDDVVVRSFLLPRPEGNVLVYNSPGLTAAAADIRSRGGATRLLLGHGHEAMYGAPELDVPAYVHERDRAETERGMPVAGVLTDRQLLGRDLEVIPTPGHTAGTTTFLWDSGRHRFLFTGDFVWIEHGEWKAVVLEPDRRTEYLESLELVRDLDFDVLVPWGVTDDGPSFALTDRRDAGERVGAIIRRLEAGGAR